MTSSERREDLPAGPRHPLAAATSEALQRIVHIAAALTTAPGACLSFEGARVHVDDHGTIAAFSEDDCGSLGRLVEEQTTTVVVEDARQGGPLAERLDAVGVRALLGTPVVGPGGSVVGGLCAFDRGSRQWTDTEVASLRALAAWAGSELAMETWREDAESARVLLNLALDAAGIGTFDLDLLSGELRWDDGMFSLFGLDPAAFAGSLEEAYEQIHPEDLPRVQQEVGQAVESGGAYVTEYRVVWPSGAVRHVAARGRCLRDVDGRPSRLLGAAYDVTETRVETDRVGQTLRDLTVGYLSMDHDWRITYVNTAGSRVVGMPPEELAGRVLWEIFPDIVGTVYEQTYREVATTGLPRSLDAWYGDPLNTWFEIRVIPQPSGLALCFLDVSERYRRQAEVDAAARRSVLLSEVTARLAEAGDPEAAVTTLARLVVPELADWCTVTRLEAGRLQRTEGWAHRDPEQWDALAAYAGHQARTMTDDAAVSVCLRTGEEVIVPALPPLEHWVGDATSRARLARLDPSSVAVLPLTGRGSTVAAMALVRTSERAPADEADLETAREVAHRAGMALENNQLRARARLLARVTEQLSDTLNAEEAVARLAQLVVPALGDWCVVTLVDDERGTTSHGLRDVGWWHRDEALAPVVRSYAEHRIAGLTPESFLLRALTQGGPVIIDRGASAALEQVLRPGPARDLAAQLAPDGLAVLPLRGRGRTVGVLSLYTSAGRGSLTREELQLASDIAGRAGLALDSSRLYRQQRDLAAGLQRSLLTEPAPLDDVETEVRYRPASDAAQVGGDWYDVFHQADGSTLFVVGDVMGHDTVAAAAMGQLRTIVRTLGAAGSDGPAAVLGQADVIAERLGGEIIASAVAVHLDPGGPGGTPPPARWANAGHPAPFLLEPDGQVHPLQGAGDLLLGVDPTLPRSESETAFEPGATLFLYTDGLVERRGQPLDEGLVRLQATLAELAHLPLSTLVDEVLSRLLPEQPDDDVVVLAVRRPAG